MEKLAQDNIFAKTLSLHPSLSHTHTHTHTLIVELLKNFLTPLLYKGQCKNFHLVFSALQNHIQPFFLI